MNVNTKWNCLIPILSSLAVLGMKLLVISHHSVAISGKITTVPRLL